VAAVETSMAATLQERRYEMFSLGIFLALGSAFFESLLDVFRKKTATSFDALTSSLVLHALTFALALPVTLLISFEVLPVPHALNVLVHTFPRSLEFWLPLAGSVAFNSVAVYLVMSALASSELGTVLPLSTLSPAFLLVTAPIILHEFPSWLGIVGILITTAGTWGLKFEKGQKSVWSPFQSLWKEKQNRKMLFVALIWAFSAPLDKRASVAGGPLWYLTCIDLGLAAVYVPFMFRKDRWQKLFSDGSAKLLPLGISNAFRAWCQFTAFCLLLVPYAVGIKRLSILFGILWGRYLFGERDTFKRIWSAAIMIAGSILILIASSQ
jgi:drug/metabolite transporter (DMT)-like permease